MFWPKTSFSMHLLWLLLRIVTHSINLQAKPQFSLGKTLLTGVRLCDVACSWPPKSIENPCLSVAKYTIFHAKTCSGLRLAFQCTHYGSSPNSHPFYEFPSQTLVFPRENSTYWGWDFATSHALGLQNLLEIHA